MPSSPPPPPPPPPPQEKKEPPPPPPPPPPVEKPKEEVAPPPPPPPPPQAPKKQIDPKEIAEFQKMIYKKINSAKEYPYQAKLSGMEGTVKVSFVVKRDGSVSDIKVVNSSGYKILDDSAVDTVKKAEPYSPFPQSVEANSLRVSVEIVYRLK
jgi:protein TonB